MVDVAQISRILKRHFDVTHMVNWDLDDQGRVQVWGHIRLVGGTLKHGQIPLQFGRVSGDFIARACELNSLAGAPDHVGGNFFCNSNMLRSLTHAPDHVGGEFNCSQNHLTGLQGLPDNIGDVFYATYNSDMPLLRLIQHAHVEIWQAPAPVSEILEKYVGKGKAFMLNMALELKKAGYEGNAKW